ncbi:Conserved oligomeric Golgi complex subunit-like protein [Emericellopsis cladophorae]|uniref:Conserved oligomeric Golgi complex subunit 2 n=1 Tax=Emericellopsis cladophorae TaxID=2686198 RepID=A0A9P9Y7Q0_9HYPO|nr:Conserved oligomeric Golgi complex subunit-like protein [Emericellopsis cladophorae]KAI6784878.1 Conserved oligomeric Golgi complex subunit-like protein [Emericellopsis cladophorae]
MANLAAPIPSRNASFKLAPSNNTSTAPSIASSDEDGDTDIPLPFPEALPRSDFLRPDFEPAAYLSALPHRHQTLEDLRGDLRERSTSISAELLELVNSNYTAFLSLGTELKGGDDKVEDVKMALMGFRRAVEDVRGKVTVKREETAKLSNELGDVRSAVEQGRKMLELSDRLSSLEERLALTSLPAGDSASGWADDDDDTSEDDDDDEAEDGLVGSSPTKLSISARECQHISALMDSMDREQPFIMKQEERLERCRNTLLLDLGTALKEGKAAGTKGHGRLMQYLAIYRTIDASGEAVKVLQKK